MNAQAKRDIGAGIAIALMFLGAFLLTTSVIGFGLIGAGIAMWVALFALQILADR